MPSSEQAAVPDRVRARTLFGIRIGRGSFLHARAAVTSVAALKCRWGSHSTVFSYPCRLGALDLEPNFVGGRLEDLARALMGRIAFSVLAFRRTSVSG